MKFDEIYDIFISIYIKIHMLYESNIINFIYDVINEKRHLLSIKKGDIVIFIHYNNKNK